MQQILIILGMAFLWFFRKKNVFQKSFERKNVFAVTVQTNDTLVEIFNILDRVAGSAII